MGIANFPFPSFTLLLTSDRVVIPGPSYVIRLAPLVVPHVRQDTPTVIETLFARYLLPTNRCNKQIDNNFNDDLIEEYYPLANLNFENDLVSFLVLFPTLHLLISDFLYFIFSSLRMSPSVTSTSRNSRMILQCRQTRLSRFKRPLQGAGRLRKKSVSESK
jgi:hypothetical protein